VRDEPPHLERLDPYDPRFGAVLALGPKNTEILEGSSRRLMGHFPVNPEFKSSAVKARCGISEPRR
jgi:hypothetical protein